MSHDDEVSHDGLLSALKMPQDGPVTNPFEQVLGHLVAAIRAGEIPAGTRLPPERELSEHLEISRVTLRAVIRALQQAGYVRTLRGRNGGSVVVWEGSEASADPGIRLSSMKERLFDTLKFRSVLEPGAARLAAARELSENQKNTLKNKLEAVKGAAGNLRLADAELHGYIAELSDCRALADSIQNIQLLLNEWLLQTLPIFGPALTNSHEQHSQLVAAILAGDIQTAERTMYDHVEATRKLIHGFLR